MTRFNNDSRLDQIQVLAINELNIMSLDGDNACDGYSLDYVLDLIEDGLNNNEIIRQIGENMKEAYYVSGAYFKNCGY